MINENPRSLNALERVRHVRCGLHTPFGMTFGASQGTLRAGLGPSQARSSHQHHESK